MPLSLLCSVKVTHAHGVTRDGQQNGPTNKGPTAFMARSPAMGDVAFELAHVQGSNGNKMTLATIETKTQDILQQRKNVLPNRQFRQMCCNDRAIIEDG
eukprot:2039544-Amphidinium_carterae.2